MNDNDIWAKNSGFGIGELGKIPADKYYQPRQGAMECEECGSRNVKNGRCLDCGEREMLRPVQPAKRYEAWTIVAGVHERISSQQFPSMNAAIKHGLEVYGDEIELWGSDTPTSEAYHNVYARKV